MNISSFIERARKVHDNKYDYSSSVYSGSNDLVKIGCLIHGKFNQKASYHLKGSGCPECGFHKSPPNKKTREQFIEEATAFHGEKFDYSEVVYIDAKTKVKIKCKLHGVFEQTPSGHLKGTGCKKCKYELVVDSKRKPLSEFIERATNAHGDCYDYSKVEFISMRSPISIICRTHGEFKQKPVDHVLGKGCKKCGNVYKPTTEEWVKLAKEKHGEKYDYSKSLYKNAHTYLTIICKEHGEFKLTAASHLGNHGCKKCSNRVRYTTNEWKIAAFAVHGDLYDYSKVSFTRSIDEVVVICKTHGKFNQQANLHLMGSGCTLCKNKTESKLFAWLKENYPSVKSQKTFDWCISDETGAKYRYDFFVPDIQTIIELDGDQHFKEVWKWDNPEITRGRDVWKMKKATDNGFRIIRLLQEDLRCRNTKWLDKELKPLLETKDIKLLTNYIVTERFSDRYDKHKELYEALCNGSAIMHV
jgi:hypothetical protein